MSPSEPPPPEVLAIAVALAVFWPVAAPALDELAPAPSPAWPRGGRRWERPASYKWS